MREGPLRLALTLTLALALALALALTLALAPRQVRAVLAEGELAPRDLGVITPYAAQAALISKQLQRLPASLGAADVEVSSVDGFQVRRDQG